MNRIIILYLHILIILSSEKNSLLEQQKNNEKEIEELKIEISSIKDQLAIEKFKSDELKNINRQVSLFLILLVFIIIL